MFVIVGTWFQGDNGALLTAPSVPNIILYHYGMTGMFGWLHPFSNAPIMASLVATDRPVAVK